MGAYPDRRARAAEAPLSQPKAPAASASRLGPDFTAKAFASINASTAYPTKQPVMAIDNKSNTSWSGSGGQPWLEVGTRPGTKVDAIEFSGGRTDKYFSLDRLESSACGRLHEVGRGAHEELRQRGAH